MVNALWWGVKPSAVYGPIFLALVETAGENV
jgi:hypothetical protein